jgi:hypothetical protein
METTATITTAREKVPNQFTYGRRERERERERDIY